MKFGLGVEQEVVIEAENVGVGEDASLCVEEEGITALAGLQALNVIGRHGVEQTRTILTAHIDAAAGVQVDVCCVLSQRLVAVHYFNALKNAEMARITAPLATTPVIQR